VKIQAEPPTTISAESAGTPTRVVITIARLSPSHTSGAQLPRHRRPRSTGRRSSLRNAR
jgi:hypothetical protein